MTITDPSMELNFSPDLSSSLIINQYSKSSIKFHCYSPIERHIELWTNFSQKRKWVGIPFTQQYGSDSEYLLQLNTFHLPVGNYEYTLRFSAPLDATNKDQDEDKKDIRYWFWYGKPDQNGTIRIVQPIKDAPTAPSFASVPQLRFVAKEHTDNIADLWHFRTQSEEPFSLGKLNHPIHRYVSLIQKGSTWLTPVTGANDFRDRNENEKCQLLLYQDTEKGDIHLWMVLCQYTDCYLSFEADDSITFHHNPGKDAHLLIVSTSKKKNFAYLIQIALTYYQHSIKQTSKNQKSIPTEDDSMLEADKVLLDRLGYCTWNAFGQDVDIYKVKAALDSLKTHKIPVEYLMLDDGWQSITEKRQLASFDACLLKFPGGLSKTVTQLKSDYPFIQYIGAWHALWGYWNGIDQNLTIRNGYKWSSNTQNQCEIGIIDNAKAFYYDFYKFLNESGVDYVKVDNQGSFQELTKTDDEQNIKLWDSFRQAMVENGDTFLQSRVLHCMSLTPHVLFDPILSHKKKSIFRNSDDFFPDEKGSHTWHIYTNAINSLLTMHYPAIGDWDMFQSDHPFAEYHASSRAISGGPIYITDIPGKHNVDLIYKLIAETKHSGYTILRSSQAPQPTFETVFNNSMDSQSIVSLYNLHQESHFENEGPKKLVTKPKYGVCGFWNTGPHEKLAIVASDLFCSKKLAMVPTVAYVVSGPDQGKVVPLEPSYDRNNDHDDSSSINSASKSNSSTSSNNEIDNAMPKIPTFMQSHYTELTTSPTTMMARISSFGSTLISISTIQCAGLLSMACLGLIDKFNGTVPILHTEIRLYDQPCRWYATFEARLSHKSSSCGFWIKTCNSLRKRRNSRIASVGLVPDRVRIDNYTSGAKDWTWCSSSGLLVINMLAVPLADNNLDKDNDEFIVQIDLKKN